MIQIAQQELGEGIAAGMGGALRGVGLEDEIAARELIADLVEILAVVFEAEAEGVLAFDPRQIVDRLE